MGQSLLDKLQAKLELLRLEKRYTRSRHRRSAFVSNAVYVDGEYVFQTPNSTGSSTNSSNSGSTTVHGIDALHGDKARPEPAVARVPLIEEEYEDEREADRRLDEEYQMAQQQTQRKRLNRFSTVHVSSKRDVDVESDEFQRKKLNRFSSMPGFGGGFGESKTTPRFQERRLSMIR